MEPKRVLIVDDDPSVTLVLAESLEKLGDGYTIKTAQNAHEALNKIEKNSFDLIVTDLRMPHMSGLELMERVRDDHPHTRLILMTAYGSTEVEATAYRLGACRYIDKPFKIQELLAEVQAALAEPEAPGRDILVLSDKQFETISQCLADLRFEVAAQCILLADIAGQLVAHVGHTEGLDLPTLISLVAGGFATSFEMARYLQESQALTLNYHEGERYDVYSSNVNEELFVVLLFDKRPHRGGKSAPQRSRIGMVWLYTRRTLQQLQTMVRGAKRVDAGQLVDAEFGTLLSDSLDQLLVESPSSVFGIGETDETRDGGPPVVSNAEPVMAPAPSGAASSGVPSGSAPPTTEETFDLQQALEMGLLDSSWMDNDSDQPGDVKGHRRTTKRGNGGDV